MNTAETNKLRVIARKISFLMPHQQVFPESKELIEELRKHVGSGEVTSDYMMGAYHALYFILGDLESKGY